MSGYSIFIQSYFQNQTPHHQPELEPPQPILHPEEALAAMMIPTPQTSLPPPTPHQISLMLPPTPHPVDDSERTMPLPTPTPAHMGYPGTPGAPLGYPGTPGPPSAMGYPGTPQPSMGYPGVPTSQLSPNMGYGGPQSVAYSVGSPPVSVGYSGPHSVYPHTPAPPTPLPHMDDMPHLPPDQVRISFLLTSVQ